MQHFFHQLKRVKFSELVQIWKLPIAIVCALFYRLFHKDLWIVCEDKNEARDNGYWFFKYIREYHPEQECVYAILNSAPDIEKVKALGATVPYGSLKHWILYLASTKKISSQKAGNPNAAIFYFLEVYGFLRDKRIFLQHGITINNGKWLYYEVTKIRCFICGAKPESEYIKNMFGYPEKNICYTGFCRFDNLHNADIDKKLILIMPTWREWIADEDERLLKYEGTTEIPKTNYFKTWTDFIKDEKIESLSKRYGVKFIFFPHRNMQKYIKFFPETNEFLEVADAKKYDIQELLKKATMMITDYSSVFFDMVYMKKPVIFYQFDYEMFRMGQYEEGYFNYNDNPFGKSFNLKEEVFSELEKYILCHFKVSEEYLEAHKEYFHLYDTNNSKRVYEVIRGL